MVAVVKQDFYALAFPLIWSWAIEEREYKSKNDFTENLDPINYEKVDKLLNNLKINSEKFLKKEIS